MTLNQWAWLSLFWLALSLVALVTMAEILGRTKSSPSAAKRHLHRIAGYSFAGLYLVFLVGMFIRMNRFGSPRGLGIGLHAYLGIIVCALLLVKILIARRYRKYMSAMPSIGMSLFVLAFTIVTMSGLWRLGARAASTTVSVTYRGRSHQGSVALGKKVMYLKCTRCHDLRPVMLFARDEQDWQRYLRRMQGKDPDLLTDEDCVNVIAFLSQTLSPEIPVSDMPPHQTE
ncbi:hypothetical protein ACFL5Z_17805 [Planctomycetota bacterium]